ncbi:MAG: hypothetical protein ABEJ98_02900 [Candidatus Nanohaloarchaea archaeon]
MSSARTEGASYESEKISSEDDWLQGPNNTVFEGRDQVINTLNGTSNEAELAKRTLDGEDEAKTHADRMAENSPFGKDSYNVKHEVVTSDNIDRSHAEELLKDRNGDNDLEFDEDGEIYNMSIHEFFRHPDSSRTGERWDRVDRNNLEEIDEEVETLTIHTVVYEDPEGREYLVHWDPGRMVEDGDKKKYLENSGKPSLEAKLKGASDSFFEDYGNYRLDEGLKNISETLRGMKERLYSRADRKLEKESARDQDLVEAFESKIEEAQEKGMETLERYRSKLDVEGQETGYSEEVREDAWEAERWRSMADAVDAFRMSYNSRKPVRKQVF